jgi:hypothetical protein
MPLLNFQSFTLTAGVWTPISLNGTVLKAWLTFTNDIIIGTSTTDATQQQTLLIVNGNTYMVNLSNPLSLGISHPILCYATAVSGTVQCTLNVIAGN